MLTNTTAPLPPFPWLVASEPGHSATQPHERKTGNGRSKSSFRAGIAASIAGLCGGAAIVLYMSFAQPMPAADLAEAASAPVAAVASPLSDTEDRDSPALIATPPTIERETETPAVMRKAASQFPSSVPVIHPAPVIDQADVIEVAPVVVSQPLPPADLPVSADTIDEFWSVIEESRHTARLVISLANRQRPPRKASAEELTSYRLRQQNADAAKGYRKYLDTLAHAMRRSPTQGVGQQLLERAYQTRGYLKTMLADSQSSQAAKN